MIAFTLKPFDNCNGVNMKPVVGYNTFPVQGKLRKVEVCFNYNTRKTIKGVLVRDDISHPFLGIIKLEDGRYILTTECQWSYAK